MFTKFFKMKKLIITNLDEYIIYKTINYEVLAYVERIALNAPLALYKIPIPNTHYIFYLCSVLYEPSEHIEYKYTYKIVRDSELQQ